MLFYQTIFRRNSTRMQNILLELTELGHSTTEKEKSHTMNNKNAPKHNNVKYANGVPYLSFEYKPIKFGRKHMKSEVGRLGLCILLSYIVQR